MINILIVIYILIGVVLAAFIWENVEINWFYKILICAFWPIFMIVMSLKWRNGGYK